MIGLVWALGGLGFALTGSTAPSPPVVVAAAPAFSHPPVFAAPANTTKDTTPQQPPASTTTPSSPTTTTTTAPPAPVADCSVTWTASQVDPMTGLPVTVHGGYDGTCAQAAAVVAEYPGAVVTVLPQ